MGRDNRNEMRRKHRNQGELLRAKLKLIREKLGITIYPQQWNKISFPAREQMLKQIYPERFVKPQPPQHQPAAVQPSTPPPEQKS
jgi:hypothetical protein